MVACRCGIDGFEIREPGRAAQFAPATADAADEGGLLSRTDLAHLDFDFKLLCQQANQLPKIHATVGSIIKSRLLFVALINDIADFHFEFQTRRNCPGAHHRFVFFGACFCEFFEVAFVGFAQYFIPNTRLAHLLFLHLHSHQFARKRDNADVKTALALRHDGIARHHAEVRVIVKKFFDRAVFKAHFHNVEAVRIFNVERRQPIVSIQFITAAAAATAVAFAAARFAVLADRRAASCTSHFIIFLIEENVPSCAVSTL